MVMAFDYGQWSFISIIITVKSLKFDPVPVNSKYNLCKVNAFYFLICYGFAGDN